MSGRMWRLVALINVALIVVFVVLFFCSLQTPILPLPPDSFWAAGDEGLPIIDYSK